MGQCQRYWCIRLLRPLLRAWKGPEGIPRQKGRGAFPPRHIGAWPPRAPLCSAACTQPSRLLGACRGHARRAALVRLGVQHTHTGGKHSSVVGRWSCPADRGVAPGCQRPATAANRTGWQRASARIRYRARRRVVPVEVKPTRRGTRLHESDEMQLVVYLLLTAAEYGERAASYGYVRYQSQTFRVQLTRDRKRRCLELRNGVVATRAKGNAERSHREPGRCARCSFRDVCGQNLA